MQVEQGELITAHPIEGEALAGWFERYFANHYERHNSEWLGLDKELRTRIRKDEHNAYFMAHGLRRVGVGFRHRVKEKNSYGRIISSEWWYPFMVRDRLIEDIKDVRAVGVEIDSLIVADLFVALAAMAVAPTVGYQITAEIH